jgi:exopolysaccharide production protein ExoQ
MLDTHFSIITLIVLMYSSSLFFEQWIGISAATVNWMAVVLTGALVIVDLRHWTDTARSSKAVLGFVALVLLSTLWAVLPDLTFRRGVILAGASALGVYIAARYNLKQQCALYSRVLAFTMIASIVVCLALPNIGLHQDARQLHRWRGILNHKNLLGEWMALATLMFLLLPHTILSISRVVKYGLAALATGVLVLTLSVTSIAACIFVIALFPFIRTLRWDYRPRGAILAFLTAAGLMFSVWLGQNYGDVLDALGRTENLSGRSVIWPIIANQILERPWLGYGYMSFFAEDSDLVETNFRGIWQPEHAHNVWLDVTLDLGLVGLALLAWILVRSIWQMLALYTQHNHISSLLAILFVMSLVSRSLTETFALRRRDLIWVMFVSIIVALAAEYRRLGRKASSVHVTVSHTESGSDTALDPRRLTPG